MPYDIGVDLKGKFIRIQIKSAWFNAQDQCYAVDARRTKTNRRRMLRKRYSADDFDFAIIYIDELDVCYIIPADEFSSYRSTVTIVEMSTRQHKPKSSMYKERWNLLSNGSLRR